MLARKWRPQTFGDLVGQGHVVQTLRNAIALGKIHCAYLFSGSRGTGKTSVARIFAKALRCSQSEKGEPCNQCSECEMITESRSVDVLEIDGASNNGVEQVRLIRDNVTYGASSGTYKIYIIDEVHMLSGAAFNALLKTLEEPAAHVVFILATTEIQKIPATIFSRCQRFEFRRLTNSLIVSRMQRILGVENLSVTDGALRVISNCSDGSLRDALSLLDQVLSYHGEANAESVTEELVVEALGLCDSVSVLTFLKHILSGESKEGVNEVEKICQAGIDLKYFANRCLEEVRLLYLIVLGADVGARYSAEDLDMAPSRFERLVEMSQKVKIVRIERMAQIFSKLAHQMAVSANPRFALEMAAVRMSRLHELELLENSLLVAQTDETLIQKNGYSHPNQSMSDDAGKWRHFVDLVMKKRPLLGALLSHANFKFEEHNFIKKIVIAFPPESFYEKQALEPKNKMEIGEQIATCFGSDMQWAIAMGPGSHERSLEEVEQERAALIRKEAVINPIVLKAKEILGAEIVEVTVGG